MKNLDELKYIKALSEVSESMKIELDEVNKKVSNNRKLLVVLLVLNLILLISTITLLILVGVV